jgi:hypothetical protein
MTKIDKELRDYLAGAFDILKGQRDEIERLSFKMAAVSSVLSENPEFASRLEAKEKQLQETKHPLVALAPELYDELIRRLKAL